MNAGAFLRDLEDKSLVLRDLARRLDMIVWPVEPGHPVVLTGMGSSYFAADTAARRLRRAGVHAVADLASVVATYPPSPNLTVVGISASGASKETMAILEDHYGTSSTIALTNVGHSELPARHTLLLHARPEVGGVACRTYLHTLVMLLQLERQLTGTLVDLPQKVDLAADAITFLLERRRHWLPQTMEVLDGKDGAWVIGPAERYGNVLQGALMLREGPRRHADGCETGDWNHVDVYLTKSLDYRALVHVGSRFDADAATWMRERTSRFVSVGGALEGAEFVVRYPHDHDPIVSLLTEVLVCELLSAQWWLGTSVHA
jgi:glucosamine 6-phosphate synthetase-like amidotransferase/phosphosugar isomerase protein